MLRCCLCAIGLLLAALSSGAASATSTGIAALEVAVAAVAALPQTLNATSVAAHVSQEGHWTLVNAGGEAFTAATPAELKHGWEILLPELATSGAPPSIYLTAETLFQRRERIADLPTGANLWLAERPVAVRLILATGTGSAPRLLAQARPHLMLEVGDEAAYRETERLLARPLDRSNFRLLALEPGGPHTLSGRAIVDRATHRPLVDTIDPNFLPAALGSLRGQTALIVARQENGTLVFKPASSAERTLSWAALVEAARAADVDLLVLKSAAAQQPGGRNWLWQKFEVHGLDEALSRATLADALDALAGPDTPLAVTTTLVSADRTSFDVHPATGVPSAPWTSGRVGSVLVDAMSGLVGRVTHQGAMAQVRSSARQDELDRRIIPFVPALVQWGYAAALMLGLAGWSVAERWWQRLWPAETASDYSHAAGYWAARAVRLAIFGLLVVPAVALVSAPRALAGAIVGMRQPAGALKDKVGALKDKVGALKDKAGPV